MLKLHQASFAFQRQTILNDASLELRPQAITCLVGGNGSGKTTLLNLITGFLRLQSGKIQLGDRDITDRRPFQIARMGVARTFQDLRLIEKFTVRENILLSMSAHPSERLRWGLLPRQLQRDRDEDDHRKAEMILVEYFLSGVADQLASEISYGQQKLLSLACCAAMNSELLLLDEPVAGVSPEYRDRVAKRLVALKELGKTIFLIEHQPDFLERIGDSFVFLKDGLLHRFDDFATLRMSPVAREAFK